MFKIISLPPRPCRLLALALILPFVGHGPARAENKILTFKADCEQMGTGERVLIAAVGDLLFHKKLLQQAFYKRRGFRHFWQPVSSVLQQADLTYGNLEGPAAKGLAAGGRRVKDPGWRIDYKVYGYKLPYVHFNYHPVVIADLKQSGFDIISTANNHALDRGWPGVDATIDNFNKANLAFSGTVRSDKEKRIWHSISQAKGMNIAWLACSYSTNGIPDKHNQTLLCYDKRDEDGQNRVLKLISELSQDPDIDAIILTPHWGAEDNHRPNQRQLRLGRAAIEAGAIAVIGAHPHVLQPWEKVTTDEGREGLIIYSTGNFISNQRRVAQRTGLIALIELAKDNDGKAVLSAAGYIPTWVVIDGKGHRVVENQGKVKQALRQTLALLPKGNRVTADNMHNLPRACMP